MKIAIAVAVVALCVALLIPPLRRWRAQRKLDELWRSLRRQTRDPEVATRLVSGERERHPHLGEAACVRRAIRQLKSDRR
jgi:low affinity Fe/Cu permease